VSQVYFVFVFVFVKAVTDRVNLHTDAVFIVAGAHRAAGHTVVVEETYKKAVSGRGRMSLQCAMALWTPTERSRCGLSW
jgi:hypothetical protein